MLKAVFETGLLAPRCTRFPITGNSNSIKLPAIDETGRATSSRFGGVTGHWKDEATEKTASKPKFRELELKLKKVIGFCYATDELLADASALGKFLQTVFVDELSFLLDDAIIRDTGAGQPLGILMRVVLRQ